MFLDIKRLYKKKVFLFIIFLSIFNVLFATKIIQKQSNIHDSISDLSNYSLLSGVLNQNNFSTTKERELSLGNELFNLIENKIIYDETYNIYKSESVLDYNYFSTLQKAIELDNITLKENEQDDLNYALKATAYVEENHLDINKKFTFTSFIDNSNFLLNNSMIFIVSILIVSLFGEEIQSGTQKLDKLLPRKLWNRLIDKITTSLILSTIYIFTLLVIFFILRLVEQFEFRDLLYPVRVSGVLLSKPAIQIIIEIFFLFMAKVMVFTSIGMFIVAIFKNNIISFTIYGLLFVLFNQLTHLSRLLQNNLNPLFTDYRYQLSSVQKWVSATETNFDILSTSSMPFEYVIFIYWIFGSVFMIFLTYFVLSNLKIVHSNKLFINPILSSVFHTSIWFEMNKLTHFFRTGTTYGIITCIIFSLVSILFIKDIEVNHKMTNFYTLSQAVFLKESYEQSRKVFEELLLKETDAVERSIIESSIEELNLQIIEADYELTNYRNILSSYNNSDTSNFYHFSEYLAKVDFGEFDYDNFNNYQPKEDYYLFGDFPTKFGFHVSKERLDMLKRSNIPPLFNSHRVLTPYDYPIHPSNNLSEILNTQVSDLSFLSIWHRLVQGFRFDILLMFIIVIFCSAGYHLDKTVSRSNRWIKTLPIRDYHLLLHRLGASYLRMLLLILFVIVLLLIIGLTLGGWGYNDFPILVMDTQLDFGFLSNYYDLYYHWMTLGTYVAKSIVMCILSGTFLLTLHIFLTYFINSVFVSYITLLLIYLSGYIITNYKDAEQFIRLLPFRYLNVHQFLDGTIYSSFDFYGGSIILLVWTVIIVFISCFIFESRRYKLNARN